MTKMTFKPHPELKRIDPDMRVRWAEALQTSAQYIGVMSNRDDTAHCCLGVLARLEGATFDDYEKARLPVEMVTKRGVMAENDFPISVQAQNIFAAIRLAEDGLYDDTVNFARLNDRYMTHPQIAQLLRGESVTVEMPDADV